MSILGGGDFMPMLVKIDTAVSKMGEQVSDTQRSLVRVMEKVDDVVVRLTASESKTDSIALQVATLEGEFNSDRKTEVNQYNATSQDGSITQGNEVDQSTNKRTDT